MMSQKSKPSPSRQREQARPWPSEFVDATTRRLVRQRFLFPTSAVVLGLLLAPAKTIPESNPGFRS